MGKTKMGHMRFFLLVSALAAMAHAWDGCISCMNKASAQLPALVQTGTGAEAELGLSSHVQDILKSHYHPTDTILSEISDLAATCDKLSVRTVDVGSCSTQVVTVDSGGAAENKKRILLGFSMHGRELITSETALYLSKKVCNTVGVDKIAPTEALANTIIDFVPVVNYHGRKRAENPGADPQANTCINQRKNRNLVDLNRNFDFEFEKRSDTYSETFPGPSAMSECETQTLAQLVDAQAATGHAYDAYIDIHAGEDAMGYVYGASEQLSNGLDQAHKTAMQQVTGQINSRVFSQTSLGSRWTGHLVTMGGAAAYESKGCASDYMYAVKNIHFSMTWEIWREPPAQKKKKKKKGDSLVQIDTPSNPGTSSLAPEALTPTVLAPDVNALLQMGEGPIPDLENTPASIVPKSIPVGLAMPEVGKSVTAESKLPVAVQTSAEVAVTGDLSPDNCFLYFNPDTETRYKQTVQEWSDAILVLAHEIGSR